MDTDEDYDPAIHGDKDDTLSNSAVLIIGVAIMVWVVVSTVNMVLNIRPPAPAVQVGQHHI